MKQIALALCVISCATAFSQQPPQRPKLSDSEQSIITQLGKLRGMSDSERSVATKALAIQIRALPNTAMRLSLANGLANLATEGDFGRDTLQEVTTTLEAAAKGTTDAKLAQPAYDELAQLVRYERMRADVRNQRLVAALGALDALDAKRAAVDFTLTDIAGAQWTRSALKGKVVLVNFWATWCPPCRKEMPDIQALYDKYKAQGFVVLAISDETLDKVKPFIQGNRYTFPVLLDAGRKVNTAYSIQGIPKSFLYGRDGRLITQTIDMRTRQQFQELLSRAGLR